MTLTSDKLGNLTSISAGYPFRGKIPEDSRSDIAVVQLKNVDLNQGINWNECIYTKLTGKKQPNYLTTGDVLFSARGALHAYHVDSTDKYNRETQFVAAPHFFVIKTKTKNLLPAYLALLLNDKACQRYIEMHSVGTLTKSISRHNLENMSIDFPSIDKQKRIIAIEKNIQLQRQKFKQLITNGEQLISALITDASSPS